MGCWVAGVEGAVYRLNGLACSRGPGYRLTRPFAVTFLCIASPYAAHMNEPNAVVSGRAGILLVNLGTPEAPTARAVRTYLREFLSDPRVIEKQNGIWKFVLNGIILPFRPGIKARAYKKIWNKRAGRVAAENHHPWSGRKTRAAVPRKS